MFDTSSRYYHISDARHVTSEGKTIIHKQRRFLPQPSTLTTLTHVKVNDGDRLDLIAAQTLGNPEQFWRIADANTAMHPAELTAHSGQDLRIPLPQPHGPQP